VKKTLRLHRHSLKDSKDNTIGPRGQALAAAVAEAIIDQPVSDHFRGPLIRTEQTLDAMLNSNARQQFENVYDHEPIHELGSQELFDQMLEPKVGGKGFKELAPVLGNRRAIWVLHSPNMYNFYLSLVKAGVEQMFHEMVGDFAIGAFHSPTVEMAAEAFDHEVPEQFPEMSCVDFEMNDTGEITVICHWVCNIAVPDEG